MLTFAALFATAVSGRGLFYPQTQTVDRVVDGVAERSYLVQFNDRAPYVGQNAEKVASWLGIETGKIQHVYEIGSDFRGFAFWSTRNFVDELLNQDGILHVEEDSVMSIAAPFTARPDYGQVRTNQYGALNLATSPSGYYSNGTYANAGSATETWDWVSSVYNTWNGTSGRINQGRAAKIWIVDTGVLSAHQEFNGRVNPVVDCVSRTCGISSTGQDCNGHGTHCAGSAAGLYRGLASEASVGSVRVLACGGSGSNADVVAGVNYVSNNQNTSYNGNIMSMSLGGGASATTDSAVNNAVGAGVIVVVAAGNNNNANACNYSPARASTGTNGVITVMASNAQDVRASFSNSGSCGTVFAPGQNIHSAWYTSTTAYNTISGTSMATPLAAGAIALYVTSQSSRVSGTAGVKSRISATATSGRITSSPALLAGTPNLIINARWQ